MSRKKVWASCLGLFFVLVVGSTYLLVNVARFNPLRGHYTVTVHLDRSGGLQPGNDVTLRGFRVGQVSSVEVGDGGAGIVARARIDSRYRINRNAPISVQALSGAGEQYIDFRPDTGNGPFFTDGAQVAFDPNRVHTPIPVSQVLENASDLIAQINPQHVKVILNELDIATSGGPDQLRSLIEGTSVAVAGLDKYLPQTVSLVKNLEVIADTTSHAQPDLETLTRNSGVLFDQFNRANAELVRFLTQAPGQFQKLGAILDQNSSPITTLASNLSAITRAAQLRSPALRALFPALQDGVSALSVPAHDREFHAVLDIWARPYCQYASTPTAPELVTDGTMPKWNYCDNPAPGLQVRGSANAPRPNVPGNGSHIPPGVDPHERTPRPIR